MKFLIFLSSILFFNLSSCSSNDNLAASIEEPLTAFPEYTGDYDGFTLLLDERFNDFNDAVWRKGDGAVGGESMCRFQDQGVQIVNGVMELEVRQEQVQPSWSEDHQQDKGLIKLLGAFFFYATSKLIYGFLLHQTLN